MSKKEEEAKPTFTVRNGGARPSEAKEPKEEDKPKEDLSYAPTNPKSGYRRKS
jgi:hypothetical protein